MKLQAERWSSRITPMTVRNTGPRGVSYFWGIALACLMAAFDGTPNAHAAGRSPAATTSKAAATKPEAKKTAAEGTSMELVSIEELSLGKPNSHSAPPRKTAEPSAPKDSLDGILGRATVTEPNPSEKAVDRMRLPEDKGKSPTVLPEKGPVPAPARITQDVTSTALAAAKASAAASSSKVNASATLPVMAGKVSVNDDPLLGVNAKEIEGQSENKNRKKRGK
jgi:hypothetical protein